MIETFKDLKHGKSHSYENLALERTANHILHQIEDKSFEDSLEASQARVLANARAIYGSTRCLDVITFAPSSSRKICAAVVEHNPTTRSYIHCVSAKEESRLAAVEHLLVITEDILHRLFEAEGIHSSGWLPATPQAQHAVTYSVASVNGSVQGSVPASVAASVPASRLGSTAPQEYDPQHLGTMNRYGTPQSMPMPPPPLSPPFLQRPLNATRNHSDIMYPSVPTIQEQQMLPRTSSDVIQQPMPVPPPQFHGHRHGKVAWKLGSEG